jgi:hypothetical protein
VETALAWLAALVTYPVGSWFTRLFLTVATLPVAGPVRDAKSLPLVRAIRLIGGVVSGAGGFVLAWWASTRLGLHAPLLVAAALVVLVSAVHLPGLRRVAGGPQLAEEAFAFAGEQVGLVAAAACRFLT